MSTLIPGIVIGFREGLEAFLIVAIALRYLENSGRRELRTLIWIGAIGGIALSLGFGVVLFKIADAIGGLSQTSKLWESASSLLALTLVTTFIVWMMRHGSDMKSAVEKGIDVKKPGAGLVLVILAMVLREGVEISLFTFAGTYPVLGILLGIILSLVLVVLTFISLLKVRLAVIFNLTLAYLILQAGFLLGYAIHEGLPALRDIGLLSATNPLFAKAFDVSKTIFDHKQGILGIPLYAFLGWYSKPEWIQFIAQYSYTFILFGYWILQSRKKTLSQASVRKST